LLACTSILRGRESPFISVGRIPTAEEEIMGRVLRTLGPTATIAAAFVLWVATVATVPAATARQNGGATPPAKATVTPAPPGQTAQPPAGYAGEETCLTCHEDQKKGYHGSPHARAADPRSPAAAKGCESCHGPGQAHVDGGGDKTKIKSFKALSAKDTSETCQTCHNRSEHADWQGSAHDKRNVTCTTCHSVHAPKSEKAQLKTETQIETCVQCHKTQVNKVRRSSHMPVREGKLQCTSCHSPHGSQNVRMLREGNSITESCASCHSEKRGPFLWEHAVGRENCVTCHDPHGSNNDRMLVAKAPMLCQRCHNHSRHPSTTYDNTALNVTKVNRIVGRACVNCHQMVHGSNHPTSGKMFLR
jgi:DmsE family decaheme c-type cytochrome